MTYSILLKTLLKLISFTNVLYSQLLTWYFNCTRDYIETTITSQCLVKTTQFGVQNGSHLDTDKDTCRNGISQVVTNVYCRCILVCDSRGAIPLHVSQIYELYHAVVNVYS